MSDSTSSQDPSSSANRPLDGEGLSDTVYQELRKVAYAKMSQERAQLTLQPTALVHEVWIRLGGDKQPQWASRAQFFYAAAEAMRRILIDRARRRRAVRHGGEQQRVDFDAMEGLPEAMNDDGHVLQLNEALEKFAQEDPEKAELVKLRFFVGLTIEESAETMGVSTPTIKRWWAFARSWLYKEMQQE